MITPRNAYLVFATAVAGAGWFAALFSFGLALKWVYEAL